MMIENGMITTTKSGRNNGKYTCKVSDSIMSLITTDGPDIDFSLFKPIKKYLKRDMYEGTYDGTPAILKRNVSIQYVDYYNTWKNTLALPVIYAIKKNNITDGTVNIVMEKLVPFVYEEGMHDSYFKAVEEVFKLTGFTNMDISPENIMMRAGTNQIVFNDLWTISYTPFFYTDRKTDDIVGNIKKSLARSLFDISNRTTIIAKYNEWSAEILSIFPTRELKNLFNNLFIGGDISCQNLFYSKVDESEIHLYTILFVITSLNRVILAKKWMEAHGKKFSDYVSYGIDSSNMPEYDQYYEDVIRHYKMSIAEVVKELGATEEEINFLKV